MSTDPIQKTPSAPPPAAATPAAPPAANAPSAVPGELPSTPEERQQAMIAHMVGAVVPLLGGVVPLIIWNKNPQSAFIEDQAKEAINFLANSAMCLVLCIILSQIPYIGIIGILLTLGVVFGTIALGVMGGQAASQGQQFRYPINLRYF
jgi:uncharacterized Tic20 family protein